MIFRSLKIWKKCNWLFQWCDGHFKKEVYSNLRDKKSNKSSFSSMERLRWLRISIKKTKILLLSYIENSHYYTYPVLNLEIYFLGDLSSDSIKFLTDLGLYTFPLHTGDVGMFELQKKSIERVEMDISCLLDSELIQDTSGLFLSNTHNIYGTESLRSQLQYLTIFNIHDVEFDENNDVVIPNFKEYQSYQPKEQTIEKDLEFWRLFDCRMFSKLVGFLQEVWDSIFVLQKTCNI